MRLAVPLCCWAALSGCADAASLRPEQLPMLLESVAEFDDPIGFIDLDGDGEDEVVRRILPSGNRQRGRSVRAVLVGSLNGARFTQANFDGVPHWVHGLDVTGDGRDELLVPYQRNDSLFLSVVDAFGTKIMGFLLTTGAPRPDIDGELPWDPAVDLLQVMDVDQDGALDLVSVVTAGFARYPRGVFVHSLPSGELIASWLSGAPLHLAMFSDLDGDGDEELLAATPSTDNGADAGGFSDRASYLLAIELVGGPRLMWWREVGGVGSRAYAQFGDIEGDGTPEVVLSTRLAHGGAVEIIEPATGRTRRQTGRALVDIQLIDVAGDASPEIVGVALPDTLVALGADLRAAVSRAIGRPVTAVGRVLDLDADGAPELAVNFTEGGFALFGRGLRPKASSSGFGRARAHGVRGGAAYGPLTAADIEDSPTALYALRINRGHLWYRYGSALSVPVGSLVVLGFLMSWWVLWRRDRLRRSFDPVVMGGPGSGGLLIDRTGRVRWSSDSPERGRRFRVGNVAPEGSVESAPASLESFVGGLLSDDQLTPRGAPGILAGTRGRRPAYFDATPITLRDRRDPHWLIRYHEDGQPLDPEVFRTWAMMSKRLTHDVKGGLGSVLNLVDRTRKALTAGDGSMPAALPLMTRVRARVEDLLRTADNFLKFVDLEDPELAPVELSGFAERTLLRVGPSVPDDIDIRTRWADEPGRVLADETQIECAIVNLIANAVNAMPDGGALSVTTRVARGLLDESGTKPGDFALLEVRDTGVGIAADHLDRVFEPGFTTAENGSGLGLAFVRKIMADHGGHVSVHSEQGLGSAFTLHIPLHGDHAHPGSPEGT